MGTNTQQQWAEVESPTAESKTTLILAETAGFQRWQDTDLAALVEVDDE